MSKSIFINNLRSIIDEKKIKQVELSRISGVSQVNIQRMLSGEVKDYKLSNVEKIADALEEQLGISRQWLMLGVGEPTEVFVPKAISREHAKAAMILAAHLFRSKYGSDALINFELNEEFKDIFCEKYDEMIERSTVNTSNTEDSKVG